MKINELTIFDSVWIAENGVSTEYIILRIDEEGVVALRRYIYTSTRISSANATPYIGSELDNSLVNNFVNRFPENIKSCFVERNLAWHRYSDAEPSTARRAVFLITAKEAVNINAQNLEPESYVGELIKYKSDGSLACSTGPDTAKISWWLRSPNTSNTYYYINSSGGSAGTQSSSSQGIRPAINISTDADVFYDSVSGHYVLSTEERSYGLIEYKINAGTSIQRPKKIKVDINSNGAYDIAIKVCNNFADAEPDWVTCDENGYAELTNTTKGSENWEIGVWVSAKTTAIGIGYVDEPVVLMEVD